MAKRLELAGHVGGERFGNDHRLAQRLAERFNAGSFVDGPDR